MKSKLLVSLLLISVCAVSCKSRPIDRETLVRNPKNVEFGVKSSADGTSTPMDVFVPGDRIGIYVIKTSGEATNDFLYDNSGYECNSINWTAINPDNTIQWFEGDPNVSFFSYYPFVGDGSGAVKSVAKTAADVAVSYEMPLNQTVANRHANDLMMVAKKNVAYAGDQPVELNFKHMLARVRFDVKFEVLASQSIQDNKITVTKIEIAGSQIASKVDVMLKSNTQTASGFVGPLFWEGNTTCVADYKFETATAVTIADLLVIPFEPVALQNTIKFYITYVEGETPKTRVFTSPIVPPVSTSDIQFQPNKYNIVTALMSLDNNSVQITSTIVDWETSDHEIKPN